MHIRNIAVVGFGSLALVLASSGAASAGEVTGNKKPTPVGSYQAASLCAFSGQNDEITEREPGRVQSYGQFVRAGLKADLPSPGEACNPTVPFEEP